MEAVETVGETPFPENGHAAIDLFAKLLEKDPSRFFNEYRSRLRALEEFMTQEEKDYMAVKMREGAMGLAKIKLMEELFGVDKPEEEKEGPAHMGNPVGLSPGQLMAGNNQTGPGEWNYDPGEWNYETQQYEQRGLANQQGTTALPAEWFCRNQR